MTKIILASLFINWLPQSSEHQLFDWLFGGLLVGFQRRLLAALEVLLGLVPLADHLVVELNVEWDSVDVGFDHTDEVALVAAQGWHYVWITLGTIKPDLSRLPPLNVLEQSDSLLLWH